MEDKIRILIGSPIHQKPSILNEFLNSLTDLEKDGIDVDYYFIDDNVNQESKKILQAFKSNIKNLKVIIKSGKCDEQYICNENTHIWKENLVWKVADYKNEIIEHCKENKYDYLFLIDSDIVLHPKTLKHLINTNKDIISEIFWTKWKHDSMPLPQVWLYDQYSQVPVTRGEELSYEEKEKRFHQFLEKLKKPGIYEVGGLGACTLINCRALKLGLNYSEIYNLSFWGEDRHFCIRAAVLGLKLFVDTNYPAYHIYRQSDINGVKLYKRNYSHNT